MKISLKTHLIQVIILIIVIGIALAINVYVLNSISVKNANQTTKLLLDQVVDLINKNRQEEKELQENLKTDYVIKAQTVAYILDSKKKDGKPLREQISIEELEEISELMEIDEIHIFDENGVIIGGTVPKYYGYSFDSGEQMGYFKPMLEDKTLSMCQNVTPNTAENKRMMYAITWNENKTRMIQIGIEPKRLIDKLSQNSIALLVDKIPSYEGQDIYIANAMTKIIICSTDKSMVNETLGHMGISTGQFSSSGDNCLYVENNKFRTFYRYKTVAGYIVAITYSTKPAVESFVIYLVMEFVFLVLSGILIIHMVNRVIISNMEEQIVRMKLDEQLDIISSIAGIFYCIYYLDIKKGTFTLVQTDVELLKEKIGASGNTQEKLDYMCSNLIKPDYVEAVTAFSDLSTLNERLKDVNNISIEFEGVNVGWSESIFIVGDRDKLGNCRHVIWATRRIQEEKERELALIDKTHTDALTGLNNRCAYEEKIETISASDHIDVVFCDVNGLKITNDTKGHRAGDELLQNFADILLAVFSRNDIYRISGDEFVVLCCNTDKESFEADLAAFRQKVSESGDIAAVGFCQGEGSTVMDIIRLAEQEMYTDKNAYYIKTGKDRRK